MPSRKQRRRRAKDRRHEYEYVYVDDEGQEVAVDEPEPRAAPRNGGRAAKGSTKAPARGRAARKVEPPSWRRVGKRALLIGPVLVVLLFLLKPKKTGSEVVVVQAIVFIGLFLPFTYMMDSMLYRSYLKRTGQAPPPKPKA